MRCHGNIGTHLLDQSTFSLAHPLAFISSKSYPLQALADPRKLFLRKPSVALKVLCRRGIVFLQLGDEGATVLLLELDKFGVVSCPNRLMVDPLLKVRWSLYALL